MIPFLVLSRHHTALRVAGCAVLGMVGVTITIGGLMALFLANLGFFGARPEVLLGYTLSLLEALSAVVVMGP